MKMSFLKILLSGFIFILGVFVLFGFFYFVCWLEEKRGIDRDFVIYYAMIDIMFLVCLIMGINFVYNSLFVN